MATKTDETKIAHAEAPETIKKIKAARSKAIKAATPKIKAKLKAKAQAAAKSAPRAKRSTIDPTLVTALVNLCKRKNGVTNEEAAVALKLPEPGPRRARAMIRDKVRPMHKLTSEHEAGRGLVYRIK
jgi:hypothetical protein